MGRRSRKRAAASRDSAPGGGSARTSGESPARAAPSGSGRSSRAERDEARRRRAQASAAAGGGGSRSRRARAGDERPAAPWGTFPLVEIVVLLALVLGLAGLVIGGDRGITMLVSGLVLGSLGGLEVSIREHLAGFRSHTSLLAGAAAIAAMVAVFFAAGSDDLARGMLLGVGAVVFALAFWGFRTLFKRRSGGLGFR